MVARRGLTGQVDACNARTVTTPPVTLPNEFLFGVATAGFQIEGGYNGPGQPSNNWAPWEREGRVEPSGDATGFFTDPFSQLDRAAAIGLNSFRLSIEWTRVEPTEGVIDHGAIDRYRSILAGIVERGMVPVVTTQHFTHPSWLGAQPWRHEEATSKLVGWIRRCVGELGDLCRTWVTINEPNILAINSFMTGIFPPGRLLDGTGLAETFDGLLAAHVAAYDAIHALQDDAIVTTNPYTFSLYELDQVATDLLCATELGVELSEVGSWLAERRRAHYELLGTGSDGVTATLERALRRVTASQLPIADCLPRTRAALSSSTSSRHLDVIAVDHYAPIAATHLVLPGRSTSGGRWWQPGRALWDDAPDPALFVKVLEEAGQYERPVWILENGMCNRTRRGRALPRLDGLRRPAYLAAHLGAVVEVLQHGVDVGGYWHWTLIDNYEWGSYEPRFGLFGMDRARGHAVAELDAQGDDAAGAFRRIIDGLRRGDTSVVVQHAR